MGSISPCVGTLPVKGKLFVFSGQKLALVFRMPFLNPRQEVVETLSIDYNNYSRDSYIMDNSLGGVIWNFDLHFDKFIGDKQITAAITNKISGVELYEKHGKNQWRTASPFTIFSGSLKSIEKIEVFGMKEYFKDVSQVDFENLYCPNPTYFERCSYPFEVDIVTGIIVSLSTGECLRIDGGNGVRVVFCNEQQVKKQYELLKRRRNAFNRPFAQLLYTTDS